MGEQDDLQLGRKHMWPGISGGGRFGENYRLFAGEGLAEYCCLTWVELADPDEVARRFGATLDDVRECTIAEARGELPSYPGHNAPHVIVCGRAGDRVVVMEPLGWHGKVKIEQISADGVEVLNLFANLNTRLSLRRAVDGRVLTVVDSGGLRFAGGEDPHGLDDRLGDLPLFPPHPYDERQGAFLELAFTLAEHRLDVNWFNTTIHRRYFVRNQPSSS
ncbi:hypothetical protein [Nonomuraea diastatica]|uniref:Uncharacterized protein n=1 Tax=Nonomuraea diastatica TaxID=1848329 RepID=A0A4V2YC24_9ACTN|nr:hypothetical protein [Nonomuraea diastatica]TDD09596.1 hypothetical protein E1294_46690 [Nonomuraea diastatica]